MPMTPEDLPPEIRRHLEEQRAAAQEAMHAAQVQDAELHAAHRRQVLALSAIMCTCPVRYSRWQVAAPGGCIVHGAYMIHWETGEVL